MLLHPAQLPAHREYNYRSFLNYIKQAAYGIRVIVTDLFSGEPLEAKIEIPDHFMDNSHVFSELPHGDYYCPIIADSCLLLKQVRALFHIHLQFRQLHPHQ